jgi:type IV pilus assembly protein PilM
MKPGRFNPFEMWENLRRRKERLGVDIDGRSVRVVRMARDPAGKYSVAAFGQLELDLLHSSSGERQYFKNMVKQLGGGITAVAANAEHPSLRVRRMSFAKMPERDLIEAIRWNFREHVEGPIEKYVVGFTALDDAAEDGKVPIMAYGLASEAVEDYTKVLKSVGLKPVALEPSASAILAALSVNGLLADGRHHVCVSFGDSTTLFSVLKGRALLFCRPLPGVSNESLARLAMRNLNLDAEKARHAILTWIGDKSVAATDPETVKRLETTVGHFLSQLVIEIQRSVDAFCIMYGVEHVDAIHICGAGVLYPGLVEHVGKTLGVETGIFDPFKNLMEPSRYNDETARAAPLYAVAVGLAIP